MTGRDGENTAVEAGRSAILWQEAQFCFLYEIKIICWEQVGTGRTKVWHKTKQIWNCHCIERKRSGRREAAQARSEESPVSPVNLCQCSEPCCPHNKGWQVSSPTSGALSVWRRAVRGARIRAGSQDYDPGRMLRTDNPSLHQAGFWRT